MQTLASPEPANGTEPENGLHARLDSQLRSLGLDRDHVPDLDTWRGLLRDVSAAYGGAAPDCPAPDENGAATGRDGTGDAILGTERDRLRAVIESLAMGLYVFDPGAALVSVNPEGERLVGRVGENMEGQDFCEVFAGQAALGSVGVAELRDYVLQGWSHYDDAEISQPDGLSMPVSVVLNPIWDDGRLLGSALILRDATERKAAEAALRSSEIRYRELMESAADAIVVTAPDTTVLEVNRRFCELTGYERDEVVGRNALEIFVPSDASDIPERIDGLLEGDDSALASEHAIRCKDGSAVLVDVNTSVLENGNLQGILRDVTDRRRMEVELRHSQKLESVGRLAAGIAHEINTPIQFVGDNVAFVRDSFQEIGGVLDAARAVLAAAGDDTSPVVANLRTAVDNCDLDYLSEEVPAALDQTLDGVERVATIVRATKSFGHPDGKDKTLTDLNQAILDTLVVARNEYKYVAAVETSLSEIPPLLCHRGDVNQVILNLVVNAAHAIAEKAGGDDCAAAERGRIRVSTAHVGGDVVVTVSDTGCGIPERIGTKVFDPFFTTKDVGRGTGQGLSLAKSIVDRHGGTITFETEEGVGTTFTVRFPDPGGPQPEEDR